MSQEILAQIEAQIGAYIQLTEEEKKAILGTIVVKKMAKGTDLLRAGMLTLNAYQVLAGCVRKYYLTEEGEDKTVDFFTEGQTAANFDTINNQVPSEYYLTCAEDCLLLVVNSEKERATYARFPRLESLSRIMLEQEIAKIQKRLTRYIMNSPEQRYEDLLEHRPDLLQRVPQYQLASYIGVKPESFSRIKRRYTKSK